MKKQEKTYCEVGFHVHHNGTSRVLKPDLAEEERERLDNNRVKVATRYAQHAYEVGALVLK